MINNELKTALLRYLKPTRRLVLEPGDPGQIQVTKIGGVPWWPEGVQRPHCSHGHALSFIAQFLLSDVPGLGEECGLLSFHYCQECAYEGNMPQGWSDCDDSPDLTAYDLTIFSDLSVAADNLGIIAEDVESPYSVTYSDRMETPDWDESTEIPELADLVNAASDEEIDFMMQDAYSFDESRFPDLVHIPVSKLGGWPSWVQYPEWPRDHPDEELVFIAQLSPSENQMETWVNGLAYIFIQPASYPDRKAKLLLQYT